MPFLDGSTPEATVRIDGADPHAYVPPELTWTPDVDTVVSSFFNYENTVGSVARTMGDRWSLYYARQSGWDEIDDDYDVFEDPEVLSFVTDRPELATAFAPAQSRFEAGMIRRRIGEEDQARENMASASTGGVIAMLATGLLDPVNLIPIGSAYRSMQMGRVAQGAAEGATAGFVSGVAAEGILQGTQYTRTAEESLINVAASTILSGVLGGGISMLSPAKRAELAEGFAAATREAQAAFDGLGPQGGAGSGGAAAVRTSTLADETRVATGVGAERAGELPIVGNPMGRLSASPSLEVRRIARDLTETPYHFEGEAKGLAAPKAVETRIKMHDGPLAVALSAIDAAFVKHRFGQRVMAGKLRAGVQDIAGRRGGDKLTRQQFMQRVGYAARRDDVDEMIPEIAEAAKHARAVIDRLKDKAIAADLLSPDVHPKTARSYLTRVWNREKLTKKRPTIEGIAFEWLEGLREIAKTKSDQVDAWEKAAKAASEKIERIEAELKKGAELDIAGLRAKGRESSKLAGELRREITVREKRIETLKRRLATAQRRQVRPSDRLPETDMLVRDLENARNATEPQRIIERIRDMGGVRDLDGILSARGFKPIKKRNGKPIKSKEWQREIIDEDATSASGRGLDQIAREMQSADEGFLPLRDAGEEDVDALVDALETDLGGTPVYADYGPDVEKITGWRDAEAFRAELERQQIDISWSNERIAAELGLIEDYVPDTPGVRARQREAGFYERRVADDLAAEDKALKEAMQKLNKAEADAADRLSVAQRLRARRETITRERNAARRLRDKYSKLVDSERELQIMTDADLRDVSRQIVDKLLGHENAGAFDLDGSKNLRGAILERSFTIPDGKIEDFLENDIEQVLRIYTRQMGADVELARAFGRPDMMDQFDEIKQAYAKVRDGVPAMAKVRKGYDQEKALAALDERMAGDIRDLAAIRDRLRGTYGVPKDPNSMLVRGFRTARELNYLRLMGGATFASLADAGGVVLTHGMSRVFGPTGMKAFVAALKGTIGKKGAADEIRRAGTALDLVLDTRARNLAEIGDDYGRNTKFERGLAYAQNKFGIANVLSIWTSFWKQFAGVISQTRILDEVERLAAGKASKAEIEHLAYLGIDYDMATRINMQYRRAHGLDRKAEPANIAAADTDGASRTAHRYQIVKRTLTDDEWAQYEPLYTKASELAAKMAPPGYQARLYSRIDVVGQPDRFVSGGHDEINRLLLFSLESRNPLGTVRHETLHALKSDGLFTDAEWSTLSEVAVAQGWLDKQYGTGMSIRQRYPDLDKMGQIEEAIAEQFAKGRLEGFANVPEAIRPIFIKLNELVEHMLDLIWQTFGAEGSDTAEGIFRMIERGEIAKRGEVPAEFAARDATARGVAEKQFGSVGLMQSARRVDDAGPDPAGIRTARTEAWDDADAIEAIRAALLKEVDTTIVTPGAGDKPLWMSTPWGKTVGQFKSFSMSAMARTTARGLQQRDAAALQGMVMMVTLGMLSYYVKTRDEDIDWDNPLVWVKEGVDRSGIAGWIFEAMNTQEKIMGGFGINTAIGSPSARYMSRNATGAVLGPTFGLGEDALKLLSNIGKGEWSASDTHRIRKLLPLQNLFYLRWMFDQVEEGINETLGVPDRRQPFRRRNDY